MENLGGWEHSEDHPDFDPNLLNVESWGVDQPQADDVHVGDQHDSGNNTNSRLLSSKKNNNSSDGWEDSDRHVDQWSTLGVTEFDDNEENAATTSKQDAVVDLQQPSGVVGIPTETVDAAVEAAVAAISETSDSVTSGDRSGGSSENNAYGNISQHLHPLGIQSSARCPAPEHANESTFHQQQQQVQQQTHQHYQPQQEQQQGQQEQRQHTMHGICSVDLRRSPENPIPGPSGVSPAAATNTSTPTMTNASSSTQHLSSLTANFMLAQATDPAVAARAASVAAASTASTSSPVTTAASLISQSNTVANSNTSNNTNRKAGGRATTGQQNNRTRQTKSNSKTKARTKKSNASTNATRNTTNVLPPFYLFDAPIELRANFMQNQRRLGLPIQHDPNSYHYGETVNGFHPQQYQLNLGTAEAGMGVLQPPNAPPPQLIDARHGLHRKNKGGQVKNEREQKRAQKITELIEQLRLQMEEGGWQVEARSKFHTLSNCAQYIKHMIKQTSDKENENQKLTAELDEKRRKLERENEEEAMQENRSDPESVTSSLTSDTTISTARHKQEEETSGESAGDGTKKRKLSDSNNNREGGSSGEDSNNVNDANGNSNNKKHRITSSEATTEESSGDDNRGGSGTGSGSGSGSGGSGSGGISKTISSVSELTDSNRGSSSNNSGSGGGSTDDLPTEQDSRESASDNREDGTDQQTTSSISSDAAVASDKTSRDRNTGHKDVVFNNDKRMSRKRPPEEVTSLERTFELNYEEVFHKSNIPQLIATTSGKIVTWNECFCKATGYRKSEIEQMTIFSLVKPENLANFFEIVAAALRPDIDDTATVNNAVAENSNAFEKKVSEESSNSSTITNSSDKNLKQGTGSESTSSQDSLNRHNAVICRNNETECGEQGNKKSTKVKNDECKIDGTVTIKKEEDSSAQSEEVNELNNLVSGNSTYEESSSNSTEEDRRKKIDMGMGSRSITDEEVCSNAMEDKAKGNAPNNRVNEESRLNFTEEDGTNKTDSDNVSGNSTIEETSSNSTEDEGTNKSNPGIGNEENSDNSTEGGASKSKTVSKVKTDIDTLIEKTVKGKVESQNNAKSDSLTMEEKDDTMSKRLLNYTAMTLPCLDFPAMKKRNQAAIESNSGIIPPLHVTVTLMSDKDPRRRCFHCVFTNSKGTNGSLGIITPELLASLFSTSLRSSRRKKNHYSSHGAGAHQRKRARGGTTRVGKSVSTSTAKNDEQKHCVKHIVSTNEDHENPPSPLLMPPPGPPTEDNTKQREK